jgi:hypothetical protein
MADEVIDPAAEEQKTAEQVYADKRHIDLRQILAEPTQPKQPSSQDSQADSQPEQEGAEQPDLGSEPVEPPEPPEPASQESLVDLLDVIRPYLLTGLENVNVSAAYRLEFSEKQRNRIEELKEVEDRESLNNADKALMSRFDEFKRAARDRIPYNEHERKKMNKALDKLIPYLKMQITEGQSLAATLIIIHLIKFAPHLAAAAGYSLPGYVVDVLNTENVG